MPSNLELCAYSVHAGKEKEWNKDTAPVKVVMMASDAAGQMYLTGFMLHLIAKVYIYIYIYVYIYIK